MAGKNLWDKFDKSIDTNGLADDVKESAENGGNFKDVPHDVYEVALNKMELTESKNGDPMVTIWFKVVAGDYKGSMIFMNQVVTRGFQIHIVNELLREMTVDTATNIEFKTYKQYGELLMDVFEAVAENYEFELDYGKGKNDFSTYKINTVFPLEN